MIAKTAALLVVSIAIAAGYDSEALAQSPAAVAARGTTTVASFQGEGAQIYECQAGKDGKLAWAFREPIATLIHDGKTAGRHYAGPSWEDVDGSVIVGKVVGKAPGATASDIPWLKLEVVSHRGSGLLANVSTVQRLDTHGGVLKGACGKLSAFQAVPYSATYVFLRAASN